MKNLADQIKQALSALAYGDIGESVGRRARHAALFPAAGVATEVATDFAALTPAVSSHKWIALGVGNSLPTHVMSYVIAACRRMQANLLLISDDAMQVRTLLAGYLPELDGIECQTEELPSASTASVLSALNLHSGLLFAVSGTENDPLRPLLRARRGLRSPVPVVLVSPKASGAAISSRAKPAHTDARTTPQT
jgi:hypothetical protein